MVVGPAHGQGRVFPGGGFGAHLPQHFGCDEAAALAGPHAEELRAAGAFEEVEAAIGLGDGVADHDDAVVGHHQHDLVAHEGGHAFAFGVFVGESVVVS